MSGPKYMSYLPEFGACHSRFKQYDKKSERDFAASVVRKDTKTLKVYLSEYHYGKFKQHTAYTLQYWFY